MRKKLLTLSLSAILAGLQGLASAGTLPVDLQDACQFAVLGATGIANTGPTDITGDVGGPAQSGFGTVTLTGTNHFTDASTSAAQASLLAAYNDGAGRTVDTTLGAELGGTTQLPGVYDSVSGAFGLTGILTLDGNGDPDAVFIFKMGTSLVTAGASSVVLSNSATAKNVFWIVGSSATLGAVSSLEGSVLAFTSITTGDGAVVNGRILALNGLATLDGSSIVNSFSCVVGSPTPSPTASASSTETPTATVTETATATQTATETATATEIVTETATATPSATTTVTVSGTSTQTPTAPVGTLPLDLQDACSFAVLGATGIANTGPTDITGDVGGPAQSGFGTVTLTGTNHFTDASTSAAQASLLAAYNDGAGRTVDTTLGAELGGTTQLPGVYDSVSGAFGLTGILTLDGNGDPDAVFIFKMGTSLVTAGASSVVLSNSATAKNVFWIVGSSATLGAVSSLEGSVLAFTSITTGNGAVVNGRVLALNGLTTLDGSSIVNSFSCVVGSPTPTPTASASSTEAPTATVTETATATQTATETATATATETTTEIVTETATATPSATTTATVSGTSTQTPTAPAGTLPVDLQDACQFAVLGATGITNTGPTNITGDVGGPAQSGFGTVTLTGTNHFTDASTSAAQASLLAAYNDGAGRTVDTTLGAELGGTTQLPGVYDSVSGAFGLTGVLTLDGNGDPDAVFIFKMGTSLVTAGASSVVLSNSATAKNVFWIVGSSATLGATSTLEGSVLAFTSITTGNGAVVNGRVLALNGLATIDSSSIVNSFSCMVASPTPTATASATSTWTPTETPTPSPTGTTTGTMTGTATASTTGTGTPSPSASASATPSATATPTPTAGPPVSPGAVDLGCADGYSILAGAGLTNIGNSSTSGYVGSFPTTSQTGFGTVIQACTNQGGGTFTQDAKNCLTAAYIDASTRSTTATIPTELGGSTRGPGVYDSASTTFGLTGILTLDAGGNTSAVFIFKTGSTLVTASGSSVTLTNGAQAKNVFWAVGTSVTLGTGSALVGTLMAQSSITLNTGATVEGRILAMNGAVTMEASSIDSTTSSQVPCVASTMTPTPQGTATVTPTATSTATPGPVGTATATPTPLSQVPAAIGGSYFYPSPARDGVGAVAYQLAESAEVTLRIHNQTGRLVDSITQSKAAGQRSTAVSVDRFASGTYYYILTVRYASGSVETRAPGKFVVLH